MVLICNKDNGPGVRDVPLCLEKGWFWAENGSPHGPNFNQLKYNCNYMGQVTIYLDDETETILKRRVRKSGQSASSWIAEAVRRRAANEWPPEVLESLGSWGAADFPDAAELRKGYGQDAKREEF